MSYTTLISTQDLAARISDPALAIVDCRSMLDDVEWGRREYLAGHIPGAVYAHVDEDLSGEKTGRNGRHPLPDPATLAATLGRLGISSGVQVVAYDQDNGSWASRLWWLLRWLGHDTVAVLDGGLAKWTSEGRPVASGVEQRARREFIGSPRDDMMVDADAVGSLAARADWKVLDARAPERYRGDVEPIDKVAGRIPGAANYPFKKNVDASGVFLPREELRRQLGETLGGVSADHVVCYCGSGVTACHNVLALEHAGLHGSKLYPGSWSEWSSDPGRPIEKG